MNTLQFVSACPNGDSFLNWDRMVYWPFRQSGPSWHYAPDTRSLSDENTDSFLVSNFLRYFVHLHPTHHSSARHRSFLRIDSVMPSLLPLEGGEVTIKGSVLPIHEVLLAGCEGGCCALSFTRVTPTELRVVVPPLPRGFYHLQFFTVQGVRVLCDENQDYFGREGVLVTALEWGKEESVSNRNMNTPASEEEFEEAKPSTLAFEAISRRFVQRCWFWRGCASGCSVVYGEEMVRWTVDVKGRFVDGVASLSLREELTPPSFRTEPTPLSLREEPTPLSFRMASTSS